MSRSRKILIGLVGLILLGSALIGRMAFDRKVDPQNLVITTGTEGGTYIKLGQLMKPILEQSGELVGDVSWVPSQGSIENVDRIRSVDGKPCGFPREQQALDASELHEPHNDTTCKADLAFAVSPAVVGHEDEVRVLMTLYDDVLQLVTCALDENIVRLGDLSKNRRYSIILDQEKSATRPIAMAILKGAGIEYEEIRVKSYRDAFSQIASGEAELAFILAGTPVDAVASAMDTGLCRLLHVEKGVDVTEATAERFGLGAREIPRFLYQNQSDPVQTLQANALLVARKDLSDEIVQAILNALFDHVDELAVANIRANEIRLWKMLEIPDGGGGLKLHTGAESFKEVERHALLVATGFLAGKYYNVGKMVQLLLQKRVIRTPGNTISLILKDPSVISLPFVSNRTRARLRARVVHTNGSLENACLLFDARCSATGNDPRAALAIMQYDVALASRLDKSAIYRTELAGIEFPELPNLTRIATLDTEKLYVIARREPIDRQLLEGAINQEDVGTVRSLKNLKVCLGPRQSGTLAIATAVLEHHGISKDINPSYLTVPAMVHRLHSGEIDAGFIVSGLPSHAVETLLDDPQLRLLSLGARERAKLVESAPFDSASIRPNRFASQPPDEAIRTIATRSVLVTNADLPFDVESITEAIFEGAAFLGIRESALEVTEPRLTAGEDSQKRLLRFMAQELPSLPLHPGARAYYEKAGLLPPTRKVVDFLYDWLTATWRTLTVILILATGYMGFIRLMRDRTSNRIGREIFKIVLDEEESSPTLQLERLAKKRDVINKLVPQRWFRSDLDKPRWRELNDLIEYWVRVAKYNLTRDLADEIGSDGSDENLSEKQRLDQRNDLLQRVRKHFEADRLDESQYELLTKLIHDELSERA